MNTIKTATYFSRPTVNRVGWGSFLGTNISTNSNCYHHFC